MNRRLAGLDALRWVALLLCAAGMSGCFRGGSEPPPPGFPKADPGFRDPQFPACPNLEGSYAVTPDAGSAFDLAGFFGALPAERTGAGLLIERGPTGCRYNSDHLKPGEPTTICQLQFRLRRAPADIDSAADALRDSNPAAYERWWRTARQGVSLQGPLHLSLYAYEQALAKDGPVQDRAGALIHQRCTEGWLELESGFREGHAQVVELSRDEAGGLIARQTVELSRSEITVWCGDGCKGIPYARRSEARWARLAPAERPALWSLDPRRLPPIAQNRSPSSGNATAQIAVIERVPAVPPLAAVDDLAAFQRVFALEDRVRSQLVDERIDIWRPEGKRVFVAGTARDNAATSELLRLLERDREVAHAQLVAISVEGRRMRFGIYLDLRMP